MQFRLLQFHQPGLRVRTQNYSQRSPAEFHRGLCGFLISGSSWTEVQCLTGLYPLWVISGHSLVPLVCPLYPQ